MGKLNLKSQNANEKIILEYLENNASNELVEKINNGTKTLSGCWNFICGEAANHLNRQNGAIADAVVFGWAIHYFEEDEIKEGTVPQVKAKVKAQASEDPQDEDEEIEEETPKPKAKKETKKKEVKKKVEEPTNKGYEQTSLFDLLGE